MNPNDILFALHETTGIGWRTILHLVSKYEDLTQILSMDAVDLREAGVQANKIPLVHQACEPSYMDLRYNLYAESGYHVVTFFDKAYPWLLRHTDQPPWVLYVKGNMDLWNFPTIGMVGTRVPTTYGKRMASQLSTELSEAGFCIVSGLARGIDCEAHSGALKGRGKTIAILGTALNEAYPRENERLMCRIAEEGLLISEYPLGTASHPGLFPLRNRIIAGIGSAVIVIEADSKSGSLITAEQAIDYNRDVYALPGPVSSPKSRGTHDLIKNGAHIITCANDVVEDYKHGKLLPASEHPWHNVKKDEEQMTGDELHILQFISDKPINIDVLIELSGFDFGHFHSVLISLLMKKKIEQQFGSSYILIY